MRFKHIGKKVETSEIRLDKNVFFEKAKSALGFKRLVIDSQGRANNEIIGRRSVTLGDNNDALTVTNFTEGGILEITPTTNRTKATPTATQLIESLLDIDGEALVAASYEAFEFSIINLDASNSISLSAGTGVTTVGSMSVRQSTSGRFQFVKIGSAEVKLYRLA
tara:strand:- start:613 stop:1107 length:495 start_codon:yes stop_codon:yes gene_type:complete